MAVTNFIWDELSDNVLLETDETDALTARYTNRPEQFGKLISQYRIEEEKVVERFYHYDGEYSTSALTDGEETVTDTFIYSAYGEEVARTGTTTNPYGYKGAVGYYTNSETDDLYVRARTYEPAMGCWLSADPLGFIDGPNLYRAYFVPSGIDPTGLLTMTVKQHTLLGKCGGFIHEIDWKPDKSERKGFIIQKVCYKDDTQPCQQGGIIACSPFPNMTPPKNQRTCADGCYIEGWYVDGNWIGTHDRRDGGVRTKTDTFAKQDCPNTYGEYSIVGEAVFIPFDWTENNPEWDVRNLIHQGPNGVINAHSLFSACWLDPGVIDFWNTVFGIFGASSTRRESRITWYCCENFDCYSYQSEFDDYPIAPGEPGLDIE